MRSDAYAVVRSCGLAVTLITALSAPASLSHSFTESQYQPQLNHFSKVFLHLC